MWKYIRRSAINKRFFSTPKSQSPLDQEIKYDLKEFLRDYEARTTKNQEVLKESLQKNQEDLKESLQQCIASSVNNLKDSQNNFKESVKVHVFLYKLKI